MANRFKCVKTEVKNNKRFLSYLNVFLQFDRSTEERIIASKPYPYCLNLNDMIQAVIKDNRFYPLIRYDYEANEAGDITWVKFVTQRKICKMFKIDNNEWVLKIYYFSVNYILGDSYQLPLDIS